MVSQVLKPTTIYTTSETLMGVTFLILYIDDLFLIGSNSEKILWIKTKLMKRFEMSDLRNIKYYLGVVFIRNPKGIFLAQRAYASHILTEFGMQDGIPSMVQKMAEDLKLSKEESSPLVDAQKF